MAQPDNQDQSQQTNQNQDQGMMGDQEDTDMLEADEQFGDDQAIY